MFLTSCITIWYHQTAADLISIDHISPLSISSSIAAIESVYRVLSSLPFGQMQLSCHANSICSWLSVFHWQSDFTAEMCWEYCDSGLVKYYMDVFHLACYPKVYQWEKWLYLVNWNVIKELSLLNLFTTKLQVAHTLLLNNTTYCIKEASMVCVYLTWRINCFKSVQSVLLFYMWNWNVEGS